MKKVAVVASEDAAEAHELLARAGFELTNDAPELVVSYGGDGTLMRAECAYPGVPKLALRNSAICKKCSPLDNETVLRRVKEGEFSTETLMKLEAAGNGKRLLGFNDIILHNADPRHAIRYRVTVNGRPIKHEIIGDGVVIATPFGSTGYYRSITNSWNEVGIGVAFNNSTEPTDHMVLGEDGVLEVEMTRGPAVAYADNIRESIELGEGGRLLVKKSSETATILVVK